MEAWHCGPVSAPVTGSRCHEHTRAASNTTARGYGAEHQRLRAQLVAALDPWAPCPRCGQPLGPDPDRLDLGHTDDRTGWTGLEHREHNRGQRRAPGFSVGDQR